MGNFISISGVIGKTQHEVMNSLATYAKSVKGELKQVDNIDSETANCCIINEANGNTSIFYPQWFNEFDAASKFISKDLNATAFALYIHDSDLWMYVFYNNGHEIDQFNPIPDYGGEGMSEEEIKSWKGDSYLIAKYVPYVKEDEIDKYLIRWGLYNKEPIRAYPTDEYEQGEWQLIDFMNKLKLPYPIDDRGKPIGTTYKIWTETFELEK